MSESVPLKGIHRIGFVVGNAKQAACYHRDAFGFRLIGYKGPETGHRDANAVLAETVGCGTCS